MTDQATTKLEKVVPLWLAIFLACTSFLVSFSFIVSKHGVKPSNFMVLFDHPGAFSELAAEAMGYSFVFPLIHLGIASCFKSKRNSNSRRSIFIGWAILLIILNFVSAR